MKRIKVEDKVTSDSVERAWQDANHLGKNKTKCKEVKSDILVTVRQQVEPVIERA